MTVPVEGSKSPSLPPAPAQPTATGKPGAAPAKTPTDKGAAGPAKTDTTAVKKQPTAGILKADIEVLDHRVSEDLTTVYVGRKKVYDNALLDLADINRKISTNQIDSQNIKNVNTDILKLKEDLDKDFRARLKADPARSIDTIASDLKVELGLSGWIGRWAASELIDQVANEIKQPASANATPGQSRDTLAAGSAASGKPIAELDKIVINNFYKSRATVNEVMLNRANTAYFNSLKFNIAARAQKDGSTLLKAGENLVADLGKYLPSYYVPYNLKSEINSAIDELVNQRTILLGMTPAETFFAHVRNPGNSFNLENEETPEPIDYLRVLDSRYPSDDPHLLQEVTQHREYPQLIDRAVVAHFIDYKGKLIEATKVAELLTRTIKSLKEPQLREAFRNAVTDYIGKHTSDFALATDFNPVQMKNIFSIIQP